MTVSKAIALYELIFFFILISSVSATVTVTMNFTNVLRVIPNNFTGANADVFLGRGANDGSSVPMNETRAAFKNIFNGSSVCFRVDARPDLVGADGLYDDSAHDITRDAIQWAYNETIAGRATCVDLLFHGTPSWLANISAGVCTSANNNTCSPTNFQYYADLVVNGTKNLTNNGAYFGVIRSVEVGNEVDNPSFWHNSQARDAIARYADYYTLYNLTYTSLKAWNSSAPVTMSSSSPNSTNYRSSVFGNISDSAYMPPHPYDFGNGQPYFYGDYYIKFYLIPWSTICQTYGRPYCTHMLFTEAGTNDEGIKNATLSNFNNTYSAYARFQGEMYKQSSIVGFDWYVFMQYDCTNSTPFWAMYGRIAKCGSPTYYAPANLTKDLARLFPVGVTIVNTSSNDTNIYPLAGYLSTSNFSVMVSNNGSVTQDILVNITGGYIISAFVEKNSTALTFDNNGFTIPSVALNQTVMVTGTYSLTTGCGNTYYGTVAIITSPGVAFFGANSTCGFSNVTTPTSVKYINGVGGVN